MRTKKIEPFAVQRGTPNAEAIEGATWLSIDPGECTGWALWQSYDTHFVLVACGIGHPPMGKALRLVIELPQSYPCSPVRPADLITLAFLAGRYAGCTHPLCQTETVFPHDWKGSLPKEVCLGRISDRLTEGEIFIYDQARHEIPKGKTHNVLDAIGIGLAVFTGKRL